MNKSHKPSIILGNGFNIALEKTCKIPTLKFGYEQILSAIIQKIEADAGDQDLLKYLKQNSIGENEKIHDIELLLWILKYSKECIKYTNPTYCTSTPESLAMLENHRQLLKNYVINIMTNKNYHPQHRDIFNVANDKHIKKCGQNLSCFKRIFTTNYDLILYWLLNYLNMLEGKEIEGANNGSFRDGFTARESFKPKDKSGNIIDNLYGYLSTNNQGTLLFLHGALHLLQKDNETYKVVTTGTDRPLSTLRNFLLKKFMDFSNLVVFDATSTEKVSCIYENSYLTKAYDKLVPIEDDLIVYGCSVFKNDELSNDEHLWQRIITSSVKNIFVSCSEETEADLYNNACLLQSLLKRYRCDHTPVDIHFFSHNQINIWESDDFYNDVLNNSSNACRLSF